MAVLESVKAWQVVPGDVHVERGLITDVTIIPGGSRRLEFKAMNALVYRQSERVPLSRRATAADRMSIRRKQPLTPMEQAFFGRPDHMVKPKTGARTPIEIHPRTRDRLRRALTHDDRFNGTYGNGIGYTEFIERALDALDCED